MAVRVPALLAASCLALGLAALPAFAQKPTPAIEAAVADKGRPEADTKRDADRKPAEMLEFAARHRYRDGQATHEPCPGPARAAARGRGTGPTALTAAAPPDCP